MSSLSFSFIKDQTKMNLLRAANEILHLTHSNNRVVFVYSVPKVGSTSIVSTLRIFASDYLDIIHIHDENMLEVFGYISMVVVLVSMMMENIKWLRIINSIACAMFMFYGYLNGTYPVVLMNACVIIINLIRLKQNK